MSQRVAAGRRRYQVTLTESRVTQFQEVAKALGMPQSIMSTVCDDAISQVLKVFMKAKEKGTFTFTDLFTMVGEQIEEINSEEVKHEDKEKRNKNSRRTP